MNTLANLKTLSEDILEDKFNNPVMFCGNLVREVYGRFKKMHIVSPTFNTSY